MAKDYYKILGISKNASPEEIKRAYRKLAHQYHPDKNGGDAVKFKEINEAYQVLSNPQKKAQYDRFGTVGGPGGFGGFDSEGFDFRNFGGFAREGGFGFDFGSGGFGDIFEDLFSGMFSQVQTEVEISLSSALLGDILNLRTTQGEELNLKIPPLTQDGTTFRFRGKGMPTRSGSSRFGEAGRRGDLLITVRIRLPRHLSDEQRRLLEELKKSGL